MQRQTRCTCVLPTPPWWGSEELRPGLILDFDADGRIVAVEILGASEHLSSDADLRHMTVA
ncbi:DUF2283 domain-containing protein [Methylobacterium tarhaniae]|uniref:DUF2283 domain-containing protein n=1 Tax=Methylobacterium tarhaniae TaxID=1187852 RepID=UPI003D07F12F